MKAMTTDYLGMTTDDDAPNGEVLSGRTTGCGCCANDITEYRKDKALQVLKDYEADLRTAIADIKTLRARVRKWKS